MTRIPSSPAGTPPANATSDEQRLRAVARQLEGVFVQQLFKAMRETVPKEGLTDGGAGEDIFTGLMDEKFATQVPDHWSHGLGESLYRQLRAALPPDTNTGSAPAEADHKRIS